jgi:hypothetical protein
MLRHTHRSTLFGLTILSLSLCFAGQASAVLFSDNFDTDTSASWTVNAGVGSNAATFAFDYSTVGIPAAPNTGGITKGLKLEANFGTTSISPALLTGLSVSPNGQSFVGEYLLEADVWLNYNGPLGPGGSGTTQAAGMGIMTNGTAMQIAGSANSIHVSTTLDGNSAADFRAYSPSNTAAYPDASPVYAAGAVTGNRNNSNAYYSTFTAQSAPGAQLTLYPQQTGTTLVGSTGFAWRHWTLYKKDNIIKWSIDGKLIATIDTTTAGATSGTNILLNHYDTNATQSTDVNRRALLFSLFDNVVVSVPEASSMAFAGLACCASGLAYFVRRRLA